MNDSGTAIRKSYFNALNGLIEIEGSPIPVVDEKLDVNITDHDIYVMMMDQVEDLSTNAVKTYWSNECLLRMQICNQRKATNTKEIVESVADQILTILFPDRLTNALSIDAPFSLTYAKYLNGQYSPVVQNQLGFIITKTLTFKNRITQ